MNGPRNHQKTELWQSMLEVLWLRLPGKTKTYQARAVTNNYAQGWRLRNVSLRIKLSISALVCLETWKESKNERLYEIFLYFCFVLFFFSFFSYCQFLKSFLRGRMVFGKKKPWQKQSTLSSRHFFMFCCCCFTWGVLTAPAGERKTGEKAGRKRKQVDQWM